MKTLISFSLIFFLLVACTIPEGAKPIVETVVRGVTDAAVAADVNADGQISNRELKDFTSNPLLWLGIIGTLLGGGAALKSKRQQQELDELYDKTHKPIGS